MGYLLFIPIFFIFCFTSPWLIFGFYWANSLPHMLITAFGQSIFGPKVTQGLGLYSNLIECPLSFHHNGITNLATHPKLQQILSWDLYPDFPKCGNTPNTQNNYSLTLQWPLGLHNTSLDAKFSVQNFSFCWKIKSMS